MALICRTFVWTYLKALTMFFSMGVPGYPNSWIVYDGKSSFLMDDKGGYPQLRKPSYICGVGYFFVSII